MRVVVYRNLNLGHWSVAEVSGRSGRGRVIGHVKQITLADVTFHLQPAAACKVARGEHRSVHAWAVGTIIAEGIGPETEIAYNPKKRPQWLFFHTADGRRVDRAAMVKFTTDERCFGVCL